MLSSSQLLLLLLASGQLLSFYVYVSAGGSCDVTARSECGYFGIQESECRGKGCCWSPALSNDVPWCFQPSGPQPRPPPASCSSTGDRQDCGYFGINQQQCESKGCCWSPTTSASPNGDDTNDTPWCFWPNKSIYTIASLSNTGVGVSGVLELATAIPKYGPDKKSLSFVVEQQTESRVHLKISPRDGSKAWEVPESIIPRPLPPKSAPSNLAYTYSLPKQGQPFSFTLARTASPSTTVFDTSGFSLIFKDQYLELSTAVPQSASLYGLAESTRSRGLKIPRDGQTNITFWNADVGAFTPDINLYGSHPFYMDVREDGKTHGVLLLNSNGMDVIVTPDRVTYKVIGGLLDLYFFMGPTPDQVLQQYTAVIGRPAMPPYWALGFHNSRWGYKTVSDLENAVKKYKDANIPLEVMWSDIDYMDRYRDFTLDPTGFPTNKMRGFLDTLHKNNQRYVPIVDVGIPTVPGYAPYDEGVKLGTFVRDVDAKSFYLSQVWPGATYFPDFFHPSAEAWWAKHFKLFHDTTPFDGIWLDMNEPSNFCSGVMCKPKPGPPPSDFTICNLDCQQPGPNDKLANPPYTIYNMYNGHDPPAPLGTKTIAASALHYGDIPHYNVHNLYSTTEVKATYNALVNITGQRPFILSRSTFPSTGKYAAHWTGDNAANWNNLKWSVQGVLKSSIWGIAQSGADICGFAENTTKELCARWISAGAFYTFVRDHNSIFARDQELYLWPETINASRTALGIRYSLLPYLYSAHYAAHVNGSMVARPLWFSFPQDSQARNTDLQWMLGEGIMVSPVLTEDAHKANSVQAYFPAGRWYDFQTLETIDGPTTKTLSVPLGAVPVHIRAGVILPMQTPALTTTAVKSSPLTLLVALAPPVQAPNPSTLPASEPYSSIAASLAASSLNTDLAASRKLLAASPEEGAEKLKPLHGSCTSREYTASGFMYLDDGVGLKVGSAVGVEIAYVARYQPCTGFGLLVGTVKGGSYSGGVTLKKVMMVGMGPAVLGDRDNREVKAYLNGEEVKGAVEVVNMGGTRVCVLDNLSYPINKTFTFVCKLPPAPGQ